VMVIAVEFADRIEAGVTEFYALLLLALSGMMFAASANDFVLVFVALELITVSFYVLNSFQRSRIASLEAGIKYLILGALASAFLVYGIALIYGMAGTTNFGALADRAAAVADRPVFWLGLLMVIAGLGFKLAAFPFQIWAPDVYQGSPTPATAFLAVGSKAAGVVLLLRILFNAVPAGGVNWARILLVMAGISILYGNLCAIPQRNLKRLMGYSSIAHAGYILLGIAATSLAGSSAILYYLIGYLFSVIAAFAVICLVMRGIEGEDISAVAGLNQRSPFLAASLAVAMISLAGIPPLAGFFGKFLIFRAVLEHGPAEAGYYVALGLALVGVVISFYYYLGVVRAVYWSPAPVASGPIQLAAPTRAALWICLAGMFYLGLFPNRLLNSATSSAQSLRVSNRALAIRDVAPATGR